MSAVPLRVLILEDDPSDAELIVRELRRSGFDFEWRRVETEAQFLAGLDTAPDLILADYHLPRYSAPQALAAARQRRPDVPVLVVSGVIGEETAVESLKLGAADYIMKDRLARLGPAVKLALERQQLRVEARQAEQQLRDSEAWFRALLDNSYEGISVVAADGIIRYSSPSLRRMMGYAPEEHAGTHIATRVHPDDAAAALDAFQELVQHPGRTLQRTFRSRHKDGSWRWIESTATSLLGIAPVNGIIVNFRDVTERKAAEDRLRLQSVAMDAAAHGILITDANGVIVYVNAAFTAMTGYTREEALGQNPRLLKSGKQGAQVYQNLWDTILAGKVWHGELTNRRKDGSLYTEDQTITPVRDERGVITNFIAIKRDITAQKQLEAQFLQAQKMETFGQLAGGVAHDFNNLLTVIGGFSDMLLGALAKEPQARDLVAEIKKAAERAAALTSQLLAFSRKQVLQPQVVDLGALVAEQEKMLRRLIGEDVQLVVRRAPALYSVRADPGQLQQVILNLAINARDAMPRGGKLTLTTGNVFLDEAFARDHPKVQPGPHVLLEMSDTGCGMPPEVLARIFEPFFTTKGPGKGTGLGLATVLGIVDQSGGVITVASQPGQGSTFRIYLPRSGASVSALRKPTTAPPARGQETILLVEDDDGVRSLVALILGEAGYTVLQARDGAEALEVFQHHAGPIHLLLTDVVMPAMSGPELANVLAARPHPPRVLYMSGYLDDAVVRHGIVDKNLALLQKPLSPGTLLRKVREVLDAEAVQESS